MSKTLKGFLKTVALFSGLGDVELDLLAQVATEVEYPRDSQIFREGDLGLAGPDDQPPGRRKMIVSTGRSEFTRTRWPNRFGPTPQAGDRDFGAPSGHFLVQPPRCGDVGLE
jgi:hypothetical protein